jgi:cytochrome d ubiquinol oxidase subunit II
VTSSFHRDGVEVWFLFAVLGTFAAFPLAFATTFEILYIPVFLLLYSFIARGISIEMIYKNDSPKWQKAMINAWIISSFLIILIIGVYIATITLGLPLGPNGLEGTFLKIFNIPGVASGLLFVVISLVVGAGYIELTTKGNLGEDAMKVIRKYGVYVLIPLLTLIVFFGANHKDTSMFGNGLYVDYNILFIFPALTVVMGLMTSYAVYAKKTKLSFISGLSTLVLYLVTLFTGAFPYVLASSIDHKYSISMAMSMGTQKTLMIMFIATAIFAPIVLGYQIWKYVRFNKKVNYNDEEEA